MVNGLGMMCRRALPIYRIRRSQVLGGSNSGLLLFKLLILPPALLGSAICFLLLNLAHNC